MPSTTYHTGASAAMNSPSTCRHAPHGTELPRRLVVAHAPRRRSPAATAATTALRSAQIVSPYDAFSTFTPVNTRPDAPSTAAATGKREYGAYA